ncbi:MAG TPA: anti-sigma factor [Mycobacteriales bacterium]|jgi:anti-sigma factor RsiW|nr:anti-sigma factor [Mycobacteriales bacterium]
MSLFSRRSLVCRQAVALMTDYLDGALKSAQRRRLEAHLAECPHCEDYLEQLRRTIELTGRVDADQLEPAMVDELVGIYRRWIADGAS